MLVAAQAGIASGKSDGATLVVAKVDRLSRNTALLHAWQDIGARFIAKTRPIRMS